VTIDGEQMEFRILGPLEARSGDDTVPVGGSRQRKALAALLLAANQTVSPDRLVSVIWDVDPPATATAQVQNSLSALRRMLGDAGLALDRLGRGPGGYRLTVAEDELDAGRFHRHLARAKQHAHADNLRGSLAETIAGLELWRGPALAGVGSAALEPELRRLEELRLGAREEQARLRIALGDYELAAAELRVLCDEHPLHERLYQLRMTALHRAGRRADALEVFRTARETFRRELGLDPSEELRAVERLVLTDDRPVPAPQPAAAASPWAAPSQLPADIPDFTGRGAEITEVTAVLAGSARPSVVAVAAVAGMGGVGKTALAVHVAHRIAGHFPDGQLCVNLRGAEASPLDPGDVLGRFLRACGVDSRAIPSDLAERAALYRTRLAGRRVLIVLDNASSEEQVRPLLPGGATCAVLITSRRRLSGLEGVRWIDQDVFSPSEAIELLTRVAGRAGERRRDAAELVWLCGMLPLAVRVAAARLAARPAWRLADLAGMLRDQRTRLDELATGDLAVRTSLTLSYQGLEEETGRLFRLLGLFDVPDFPAWIAGPLLRRPVDAGVHRLEALVDAQLLATVGADAAGQRRYRFHDLVRLYARERADREFDPATLAAAYERGFGAWLAVAGRMAERVPGPCYAAIHGTAVRPPFDFFATAPLAGADPLLWFDAERAALLSAIRQACALGYAEVAFDLAGCMEKYFDIRGMYVDWRLTNEAVLATCRAEGNRLGEAVMLRGLIDVVTWNTTPQTDTAMTRLHADAVRLLEMFTELGNRRGMADAMELCSWGLTAQGDYPAAVEAADRALRMAGDAGHLGGQARAHVASALAHAEQLKVDEAIIHLRKALEAAQALGNPRYEATVLQFLGNAYWRVDEPELSQRHLDESLAISRRFGDRYAEAFNMLAQARLHLSRHPARARDAARTCLILGREFNMPHYVADALAILGTLDLAEDRHAAAVEQLEESVRLWRTRGWPSFLAATLNTLGHAYATVNSPLAHEVWAEAAQLYTGLGLTSRAAEVGRTGRPMLSS
jgi:DNA-binding SARP family transcriptional activator